MKILSIYLLFIVSLTIGLSSCQTDEVAPFQAGSQKAISDSKAPGLFQPMIFPPEIIRTVHAGATTWQITFNDPYYDNPNKPIAKYPTYFSTVDGSCYTSAELNADAKVTYNADLSLLFFSIYAPGHFNSFTFQESVRDTQIKPSDLGLWELAVMTTSNPSQFEVEFENSPYEAKSKQPYNYKEFGTESSPYQKGDIFLFKTDRLPNRYGVIYIKERPSLLRNTNQFVIEVTVQSDNNIVELGQ